MTESRVRRPGKLGFGLMRLPKKGFSIDIGETCEMVDRFLQVGFDYFDTALLYPGSEPAVKKALTDRIPRERYRLATKLNAMIAPTEKAAKQQLTTSLERTGAGYFDYYLLHALMDINWRRYEKFHLWEFLSEQKALGRVRKIGFSFHAGPELLDRLLTEHPEVDLSSCRSTTPTGRARRSAPGRITRWPGGTKSRSSSWSRSRAAAWPIRRPRSGTC